MGREKGAIRSAARRVSVVIPTWNGGGRFRVVLEALAGQDLEGGLELVVIDSGSGDGTAELAASYGACVFKIPQESFNHGRSRNLAIQRSRGEFVALLTQDAVPMDRHYLRSLVEPYSDPRIAGVYARQFPRPDCDPLLSERLRQWSASRSVREVHVLAEGDPSTSRERFEAMVPLERYRMSAFDNVASSLRRSVWEGLPFPERAFGEDVAWARSALLAGHAIGFEPGARVEHSHRIDLVREFKRIYCDHRNLYELFQLRNVPSWREVLRGAWAQQRFYRDLLGALPLSRRGRLYWRAYSIPYALAETTAQFLGARSHWKTGESSFWRAVDRRIQRNV